MTNLMFDQFEIFLRLLFKEKKMCSINLMSICIGGMFGQDSICTFLSFEIFFSHVYIFRSRTVISLVGEQMLARNVLMHV